MSRASWDAPCLLACAALCASACSLLLPFDELSDAPSDAAAGPDAGGLYPDGSWCAAQPSGMVLCDDFDFETTAFERWTAHDLLVEGSGGFSDVAESPPHSFELSMPPLTAGTYTTGMLEETVSPKAGTSSLSLSFSFQPAYAWDAGEDGDVYIAAISQGPGIPRSSIALTVGPSGTSLAEQVIALDGGSSFPPFQSSPYVPTAGHWTHIAIDLDLSSSIATVSLDGAAAITLPLAGSWSPAATSEVDLGDWYITQTTGFEVLYDDAVIRQR